MNLKLAKTIPYIIIILFLFIIFTHNNKFPFFYHPDEPGKIFQVNSKKYNFHHPLLLINTSKIATYITTASSEQETVITGRTVSAIFSIFSIIFIMIIINILYGYIPSLIAGLVAGCDPLLIKTAHYMKEDTSLLFGFALSFLALTLFWKYKNLRTILFLGVSAAIAASSKYIGIIVFPITLIVILMTQGDKIKSINKKTFTFLISFILTICAVNYQVFNSTEYIKAKFKQKYFRTTKTTKKIYKKNITSDNTVTAGIPDTPDKGGFAILSGHGGLITKNTLKEYLKIYYQKTFILIPIFFIIYIFILFYKWKSITLPEKTIFITTFIYFILILAGKSTGERYLMPVTVFTTLFAVISLINFFNMLKSKKAIQSIIVILIAITISFSIFNSIKTLKYYRMGNDTRIQFVNWLNKNINKKIVILSDSYTRLEQMTKNKQLKNKNITIIEKVYSAEFKTLNNARKHGITHIATCSFSYDRFFEKKLITTKKSLSKVILMRNFYKNLFSKGTLLWESKRKREELQNPKINFHKI